MDSKLLDLAVSHYTSTWMKDFLTDRSLLNPDTQQWSQQGYVLSLLLYNLYTHAFTPTHYTNMIIKFEDKYCIGTDEQ